MPNVFEELRQELASQVAEGEFPEWLCAEIQAIADNPSRYLEQPQLVATLLEQVRGYDPYAGAGCFSASYGIDDIQRTLKKLTE